MKVHSTYSHLVISHPKGDLELRVGSWKKVPKYLEEIVLQLAEADPKVTVEIPKVKPEKPKKKVAKPRKRTKA